MLHDGTIHRFVYTKHSKSCVVFLFPTWQTILEVSLDDAFFNAINRWHAFRWSRVCCCFVVYEMHSGSLNWNWIACIINCFVAVGLCGPIFGSKKNSIFLCAFISLKRKYGKLRKYTSLLAYWTLPMAFVLNHQFCRIWYEINWN